MLRVDKGIRCSPPIISTVGYMIEEFLIGQLLTIASSAKMFDLNTPPLFNNLVGLSLELDHWRQAAGMVSVAHTSA